MFLGDYGAEVIKVEKPDLGDEIRYWGNNKNGVGLMYKLVNRNKRSVTADLRTPLGVEIVMALIKDADIIIENYRKGTLEKWGLDYETLSQINPGLIMVRITGFGQTGPNSHRPGFGTLAEGYAGFASITGYSDRPPLLPGFGLADETSGLMGAYLALAALRERDQNSGRGQIVEFGIYEPLFTLLGPQVVDYDQLGIIQERNGSRLPFTAPRNTYRTRDDKWVSISGSAQSTFERMCEALNVPGLVNDPRFLDNRLRIQNAEALDDALQNAILEFDRDNLIEAYRKIFYGDDKDKKLSAAKAWSKWEASCSFINHNPDAVKDSVNAEFALAFALIENHYFVNKGFLDNENQLLDNIDIIRDIPSIIIQGRYDVCTPLETAWELHKNWPEAKFIITPFSGHSAFEKEITHELILATDRYGGVHK